jgi:hypothetical protein
MYPRGHGSEALQERPAEDAPGSGTTARGHYHVLFTQNTEYHCRNGTCIAVRDRKTGNWLPDHQAVNVAVISALHLRADKGLQFEPPAIGDPLVFYTKSARMLVTSPIQQIICPEEDPVPAS